MVNKSFSNAVRCGRLVAMLLLVCENIVPLAVGSPVDGASQSSEPWQPIQERFPVKLESKRQALSPYDEEVAVYALPQMSGGFMAPHKRGFGSMMPAYLINLYRPGDLLRLADREELERGGGPLPPAGPHSPFPSLGSINARSFARFN